MEKNQKNNKNHKLIKEYLESINESNKVLSKVYVTERLINSRNDFSTDIYWMRSQRKKLNNIFKKNNEIKNFIKISGHNKLFTTPIKKIIKKNDINKIKKKISHFNLKNNNSLIEQIEENIFDIINVINNLYNAKDFKKILSLSKSILDNKKKLTVQEYIDLLNKKLLKLKENNNTKIYKMHLKLFKKILKNTNLKSKHFIENYINKDLSLIDNLNKLIKIYNKIFFEIKTEHNLNHPLDIILSEFNSLRAKGVNYTKIIYYSTKDLNTKVIDNPRCIIYSLNENNEPIIKHLDIKNLENQKWVNIRELESMILKKKYIIFFKITSLLLMATGPVLFILPGPQVFSWIGFAMFLVYFADLIKLVVPFLPLWFQDQFLKYTVQFDGWKENRELKKSFKPINKEKIKKHLLETDSTLTKDEINSEIKKIEYQNTLNKEIYNEIINSKSQKKSKKKPNKKFFDKTFFKDDSYFYEPLSNESIFGNNWKNYNDNQKKQRLNNELPNIYNKVVDLKINQTRSIYGNIANEEKKN